MTRPRVVLAEDHPTMATELHALLASDYDVVDIVTDGWALMDAAERLLPDAIVCDIAMPRLGGLAAANSILAVRPHSRIVFVTVQDDLAVIRRALDAGARAYVLKCDAGDELVPAVQAAIEGDFYLSVCARRVLETANRPGNEDEETR